MNKVLILTMVHPVFDTRVFHKQAKSLAGAGYEVNIIAQHDKSEVVDGIRIMAIPKHRNRFARFLTGPFAVLRKALSVKADYYHVHDPELLPLAVLLKIVTRKTIIFDVHENIGKQILNKQWIPKALRGIVARGYITFEKLALRFVDTVIIAEDSYLSNYSSKKNTVPIRNYPLVAYTEKTPLMESNGSPSLVYVGGVSKIRGALEVVEALNLLGKDIDIRTSFVGPVRPSEFRKELDEAIEKYALNVSLTGRKSYSEVWDHIVSADIGLCILQPNPNYIESLPTKLFEYMAAGKPVISSNFPLWREIVETHDCGISVDPLNHEEISRAIKLLAGDRELRRRLGENGRQAVISEYNWESEAKTLLKIYARQSTQ